MKSVRKSVVGLFSVSLVLLGLHGGASRAAVYTWIGGTSSDWTTGANWSGGVAAPTGGTYGNRITVTNPGANTLTYGSAQGSTIFNPADRALMITAGAMEITGGTFNTRGTTSGDGMGTGADSSTLTISGGSYLNDTSTAAAKNFEVANSGSGTATLNINSGSFTVSTLRVGGSGGATGTAIVNLNGGTLNVQTVGKNVSSPSATSNFYFNGGLMQISGSTAAFQSNVNAYVNSGGVNVECVGSTTVATIGAALLDNGGGGGLTKTGSGRLVLTGNNTYTGTTTLGGSGTVRVGNNTSTGTLGTGNVIIGSGVTLAMCRNDDVTVNNQISGDGGVYKTVMVYNTAQGGVLTLTGNNTYTGTTQIETGTIRIGADSVGTVDDITSSAIGKGTLVLYGIPPYTSASSLSSDSATPRTLLNKVNFFSPTITLGDAVKNGKLTFLGQGILTGNTKLIVNSDVENYGVVSGSRTLTLTTAGSAKLKIGTEASLGAADANLTLDGGTLDLSSVGVSGVTTTSLGSGYTAAPKASLTGGASGAAAAVAVSSAVSSLNISSGGSGYVTAPTVTFSSPQLLGGVKATGTAVLTGGVVTGITITNPGSGYTSNPTIALSGASGTGAAAAVNGVNLLGVSLVSTGKDYTAAPTGIAIDNTGVGGSGLTATVNGIRSTAMEATRNVTLGAGGGTIVVGAGYTPSIAGVISGAGSLTKTGDGTLTLSGNSVQTGKTAIAGGTVRIGTEASLGAPPVSAVADQLTLDGGTLDLSAGVSGVTTSSLGSGYTAAPKASLIGGAGSSPAAVAVSSAVSSINISSGGSGYATAPAVTFSTPQMAGGVPATGTAVLTGGVVTSITITNAGSGYTSNPTITFGSGNAAAAVNGVNLLGVSLTSTGIGYTAAPTAVAIDNTSVGGSGLAATVNGIHSAALEANRGVTLGAGGGTIQVGAGYTPSIAGVVTGTGTLTKTGPGSLTLTGANDYIGVTTVKAGTLELGASAQTPVLTSTYADIQGGKMLLDYSGGAAPDVLTLLDASYDTGWTTGHLRNTTAGTTGLTLGWKDNGSTRVTVMATYPGDANLDGIVDATDLNTVLSYYNASDVWNHGDFNYDGSVNATDLNTVLSYYNQTVPSSINLGSYYLDAQAVGALSAAGISTVPEPPSLILLTIAALVGMGIVGRRRLATKGSF